MPVRLAAHEELPGPLTGYRLIERLGRGGFGEVWKVEAPGGLHKAMKFVFGDLDAMDDEESRPAEQELKAINRVKSIRHPYILSLERFDRIDGQLIITMELAEKNLWDRFRECRAAGLPGIPRDELLRYMDEAAEALDLMNDHYQIQHLDVKPQNLFLMYNHVKVADFGLAKDFVGDRGTITGGVTPVYAPPETFEGYVSRFTDQYSLAIVYQELLTGRRPFDGANTKQLVMQHLNGVPDLASLPAADRPAIARSLAKKPDERWPNCVDLAKALRRAGAAAPATPEPVPRTGADTPVPPKLPPPPVTAPMNVVAAARTRAAGPAVAGGPGAVKTAPRPNLPTPALVTPRAAAGGLPAPAVTVSRDHILQTGRMSSLGVAPPEKSGPGVLFPALVVGVGATGLAVLRTLRQFIREQFGGPDAVPTVRFLYIDTDPDAAQQATQGPDGLAGRDVIIARLNRPSHYLQQTATPAVEQWLPPGLLYRLPKHPGPTGGVRAFGRLALCDHYRVVAQRVRQEVEAFLTDAVVDQAGAATGLGVRSNRVRAYVVAGLAGGTGSGMALDLAYILKHELHAVGYRKPAAVGVLLAPPADKVRQGVAANVFAALAEIHHLAAGVRYQTKFDAGEAPVVDPDGPFTRCAVVPLPKSTRPAEQRKSFALAARGLYAELLTTAGRTTDDVRDAATAVDKTGVPVVQAFGLHRLTWPRAELLTAASRRFAAQLLQRWAGKETAHLREPLAAWLDDLWAKQDLAPAAVVAKFDAAARLALGDTPVAVFEAAVDTLRTRTPGAGRVDASAACTVLEQLLRLVGKPEGEPESTGTLEPTLQAVARKIAADADADLSMLAVSFIEQPQYRLAGSEEALTQLTQRLKETIESLETQVADLGREVADAYGRLFQLIGNLGLTSGLAAIPGRKAGLTADLVDALRVYPARRLHHAEWTVALSLYRGLLGNIPEYVRDVNYCRARLAKMEQAFAPPAATAAADVVGQLILPAGCATLGDTAERVIDRLTPDELLAFDQAFQADVRRKFRGLANVCLKEARTDDFVAFLAAKTRAFLDERLERTDPATMLLRYRGDGPELKQLLSAAYAAAGPDLAGIGGPPPLEAAILALPAGEAADEVRAAAAAACPGVEFIPAPLPDDIMVYRECPRVPLADLGHLGPAGFDAYRKQAATDHGPTSRGPGRRTRHKSYELSAMSYQLILISLIAHRSSLPFPSDYSTGSPLCPHTSKPRPSRSPATSSSTASAAAASGRCGGARPPAASSRPSRSSTATCATARRMRTGSPSRS